MAHSQVRACFFLSSHLFTLFFTGGLLPEIRHDRTLIEGWARNAYYLIRSALSTYTVSAAAEKSGDVHVELREVSIDVALRRLRACREGCATPNNSHPH